MTLRRARVSDLDSILILDDHVLKTNWSDTLYLKEITNAYNDFYVLELDQKVIAFSLLARGSDFNELHQIAVDEAFQKMGFGSILLERNLLEADDKPLYLEVSTHNENAIKFYNKYGFESVRIRKNYYGLNDDAIEMRKRF